jgi:predicted nucleic acid-binding protein
LEVWDASAVLCLLLNQKAADQLEAISATDEGVALWWGTRVEAVSCVCRLRHANTVGEGELTELLAAIERVSAEASEIEPSNEVRSTACRLLRVHELRAADALQLAAALVWAGHNPSGHGFVCLDRRLRQAAEREGFVVLPR